MSDIFLRLADLGLVEGMNVEEVGDALEALDAAWAAYRGLTEMR